jgi:hypothetical protein
MNVEQLVELELGGETEVLGDIPSPVPLCSQILDDLTWDGIQAAVVGSFS